MKDIPLRPSNEDVRLATRAFNEAAIAFAKQGESPDGISFGTLIQAASHCIEMANEAGLGYSVPERHVPIVRAWVSRLGLRHQGVLMSAVRGCDGTPKDDDPSKWTMRFLRSCTMRAHVGDPAKASTYMVWTDDPDEFWKHAKEFLNDFDRYPTHFVLHVMQAAEVCGYCMPVTYRQKEWWEIFYYRMCGKLHVSPESSKQMNDRLSASEAEFGATQRA